jgi:hypothetical protein
MVTIKELVKKADPTGDYKRDIESWGSRLARTPPSDPRLADIFQTISASIGDLEARTEMVADDLVRRGEITAHEHVRLREDEIPLAFGNMYWASLEEFKEKYKVVK